MYHNFVLQWNHRTMLELTTNASLPKSKHMFILSIHYSKNLIL